MGSPRKPSVFHRASVVHAHTDCNKHRVVLLRTALDSRHRAPPARLETLPALRWPVSTHYPPSSVYCVCEGRLPHEQFENNKRLPTLLLKLLSAPQRPGPLGQPDSFGDCWQ
mgnify:CR=1 FL=1